MTEVSPEIKAKISEGMKRSHALRKKQKAPATSANGGLLGRLRKERDELNVTISNLEKRGVK